MPPLPRCSICGTTEQLLRCSSCKTAYYCSPSHQHIDWPLHKQECRQLAKQKNGMRMQQLQQAIAATTLSTSNQIPPPPPANDSNLRYQQQQQQSQQLAFTHGGNKVNPTAMSSTTAVAVGDGVGDSNATGAGLCAVAGGGECDGSSYATSGASTATLPHLSVILGTNENEILHSQAETVLHHSNSDYFGSFDANSTTMEQMLSNGDGGCDLDNGTTLPPTSQQQPCTILGDNLLQFVLPQQQQQQQQQMQLQEQDYQQYQQQTQLMPPPQPLLQHQMNHQYQHQFTLSTHKQNQIEKSSSYQIGHSDENAIGNVNERRYEELCRNIINDMNQYGLSVVDDFLGTEKGLHILNEVHRMYAAGVFKDGQLVNNILPEQDSRTIRGDKITWVKGVEPGCANVGYLINQIDAVICRANTMRNNGKLGNYNIKERTKAMVACYPGSGSHYIMHVDNPNKDGRVITAIYYLNVNWDTKNSGGVLRIFPEHGNTVADIEPKFDRLIFFWSDKRNPHEVQPAHRTRYAITVWYFDANEREAALSRCKYENVNTKELNLNNKMANTTVNANNTKTQATNQICT